MDILQIIQKILNKFNFDIDSSLGCMLGYYFQKMLYPYENSKTVKSEAKATFKSEQDGFEAVCSYCGIDTSISFKPDGVRPIFCKDCLTKMKNKELIIEKNHKGEYVVIQEPGKKEEEWGVSLDSLKSGDSSLEELKKKLQFKEKGTAKELVKEERIIEKKPIDNKKPAYVNNYEKKPNLINNQKKDSTPAVVQEKKPLEKTGEDLKKDNILKPGQRIEF